MLENFNLKVEFFCQGKAQEPSILLLLSKLILSLWNYYSYKVKNSIRRLPYPTHLAIFKVLGGWAYGPEHNYVICHQDVNRKRFRFISVSFSVSVAFFPFFFFFFFFFF